MGCQRETGRRPPRLGGNASTANCKLQTAYDYKQGELTFLADTAGTVPDNRYTDHLPALVNKTDLLLFDQGYFKLTTVNAIMMKGAFFLTRLFLDTTVHDVQTSEPLDLGQVLRAAPGPTYERQVRMGQGPNQTCACRLVCLRVSAQVANARRRRFKAHARRQGRTGSPRHVAFCDWTLLITNVPEPWLPLDMVRALYTLRWQIELLFKQFKSILRVHQSATGNAHRLRCELYGKLIAAVWVQRLHAVANTALWNTSRQEISLAKLDKRLQERAFLLAQFMMGSEAQAMGDLSQELKTLLRYCRKHRQRSRMTTLEMLEAGFDPKLHTGKSRVLSLTPMGFVQAAEVLLFRQKDQKPLALGVMRKMPSLLAEFSGGKLSCLAQTVPACFLNWAPGLGHAEWADLSTRI